MGRPCVVAIPFYPLTGIGKGRTLALRAVVVERIAGFGGDAERVRNPPVTACGGASPLWQGGLWSRDGPASAGKPPLLKGGGPPDKVRWRGDSG